MCEEENMSSKPAHSYGATGKTALITGAAGLLGKEHAAALLEIGARVVITDIDIKAAEAVADKLAKEYRQAEVLVRQMDVTNPKGILYVYDELKSKGGVHILINNAAVDPKVKKESAVELSRLENFPIEDWDHQIKVGLTGAFFCAQVFGKEMANNRHGVIINIASDLALIAPDQRIYRKEGLPEDLQPVKPVTYSVIKHGLIGLTRYLATYWSGKGIRVNALCSGGVFDNQPDDFVSKLTDLIPMGRMADLNEYRGAIQFLCSEASSYMTGACLVIDGGRTAW